MFVFREQYGHKRQQHERKQTVKLLSRLVSSYFYARIIHHRTSAVVDLPYGHYQLTVR